MEKISHLTTWGLEFLNFKMELFLLGILYLFLPLKHK